VAVGSALYRRKNNQTKCADRPQVTSAGDTQTTWGVPKLLGLLATLTPSTSLSSA